jgi:hypothetical protein
MSKQELFPIYLILGFLLFRWLVVAFQWISTLAHELGHTLAAKLSGKNSLILTIGSSPFLVNSTLAGVSLKLSIKGEPRGSTSFEGNFSNRMMAMAIIWAGPVVTLAIILLLTWSAFLHTWNLLGYMVVCSAWLANVQIIVSSLSMRHDPSKPVSDLQRWLRYENRKS